MGKRTTIAAVTALALLLAGIVLAVVRLYKSGTEEPSAAAAAPAGWSVLKAIPSDANAVLVFDGSAKAARILADSTGFIKGIVSHGNSALMAFLSAQGRQRMAVSLHNSGSLVPLVAIRTEAPDSVALVLASQAGLKTRHHGGFLLACRSETFLNAAVRHLEEESSILGTRRLNELVRNVSGPAVLFLPHSQAGKLVQVYAGTSWRPKASFVKELTDWSAWSLQELDKEHLVLKGIALPGDEADSYFYAFSGTPAERPEFPEVLPYYTATAISIPVGDAESFLRSRRTFEDGNGRLPAYDKFLKTKGGRPQTPEEWFRSLQPKELVRVSFRGEDGVLREAVLIRSARDLKLAPETSNPYRACLGSLLGSYFAVTDTVCASVSSRWSVFADTPTLRCFQDRSFLEYSLKDRLSDASVDVPEGFVAYTSFSDAPERVSELFSENLATPLQNFVRGAGFAPAMASLDLSGAHPSLRLSVDTRVLKGSKVQVLERDTTVVVPTGLFPVVNYTNGKTNYLYQNAHKSICLNDENGKGVWGIPFKEKLCGRVQNIDYYNNKKIQFLFCASDKLWLLDRLGHWVNGFPVTLPKPVLLGPDAYDFTGAGGYTVMVLHTDNSLERYNLHGQKPEGWKGIRAPETVKNLPELIETRGKRFWVVRTSVRTLIYPFEGGDALTREEGGRMIKPDAEINIISKGISAACYDGRSRDFKLN